MTTQSLRFTSTDLKLLPDDGKRYEVIDGELYVSKQPQWHHQTICFRIGVLLDAWSRQTGAGKPNLAPGVIFADDNDVAPDLVWISTARLAATLGADGHLHGAPELVVEVLSPGSANERRDRETKRKLYSRRGVDEYWIVDWRIRAIDVFRRRGDALVLAGSLHGDAVLSSPLFPDFAAPLTEIFNELL